MKPDEFGVLKKDSGLAWVECSQLVGWWLGSCLGLNSFCLARTAIVHSIAIAQREQVMGKVVYFNLSVELVKSSICWWSLRCSLGLDCFITNQQSAVQTAGSWPSSPWIKATTRSAGQLDVRVLLLLFSRSLIEAVVVAIAVVIAITVVAASRAFVDIDVAFKAGWASFVDGSKMRGPDWISRCDCN